MQGTAVWLFIISPALKAIAFSSSVRGLKFSMKLRLSFICSRLLMPESTIFTSGRLAAKRMAQLAGEALGSWALKSSSASAGTRASVPPLTGSITITHLPCFTATS